jgi:glycine/D-amino acid oxidase-like deaminating enzyme
MGSTPDGYPHIGALPGKEGQYVCVGFNGAGMPHIFLSAKGLASMIRDHKSFEEVGIPRIFKVTEQRIKEEWDKEKFTKPKGLRR